MSTYMRGRFAGSGWSGRWARCWRSLAAAPAQAAPAAEEKDASRLFFGGKFQEALAIYVDLAVETANPIYMCEIGRCHQRLGNLVEARRNVRECLAAAKLTPAKKRQFQAVLAEIDAAAAPSSRVGHCRPPPPCRHPRRPILWRPRRPPPRRCLQSPLRRQSAWRRPRARTIPGTVARTSGAACLGPRPLRPVRRAARPPAPGGRCRRRRVVAAGCGRPAYVAGAVGLLGVGAGVYSGLTAKKKFDQVVRIYDDEAIPAGQALQHLPVHRVWRGRRSDWERR